MINQHPHPPLTAVEKALIEAFCISRPCQPLRALYKHAGPNKGENRDAFYAACRFLCTRVHFCPLEEGSRYVESTRSGDLPAQIDCVVRTSRQQLRPLR